MLSIFFLNNFFMGVIYEVIYNLKRYSLSKKKIHKNN